MPTPLIRVQEKTKKVAASLASRDGRSMAQIIEESLVLYFKKYPKARDSAPSRRGRKKLKGEDS